MPLLLALMWLLLAGCSQDEDPRIPALEEEVSRLRLALGKCQARRVACEEDDRFLYSAGMRALESGDVAVACGRFEKILERYPTSPLGDFATERVEACTEARASQDQGSAVRAEEGAPITIERAWLREDQFGVPLAHVRLRNVSNQTIRQYKLAIQCYDDGGGVIRHLSNGQEWFIAAGVDERIAPDQFAKGGPWAMTGFLTCFRFDVVPLSVRYEDRTTWER